MVRNFIKNFKDFLYEIGIENPDRFIYFRILPFLIASLFFLALYFFLNFYSLKILSISLSIALFIYALLYPYVKFSQVRQEVENQLPYFITYLSTLFMSGLDMKKVLEIATRVKYFNYLSNLMERLRKLVYSWNFEFNRAIKYLSSKVVSKNVRVFLDRLSIAYSSSTSLGEFFERERRLILDFYEERYRKILAKLDTVRDVYATLYVFLIFLFILILVVSYMYEVSPFLLLAIPILLLILFTLFSTLIVASISSFDKIYEKGELIEQKEVIELKDRTKKVLALVFLLFVVLSMINILDFRINFLISILPLLYISFLSTRIENKIIRLDYSFSNFLRVFGVVLESKGKNFLSSLEVLLSYDLGEIGNYIKGLYNSLKLRLDLRKSWQVFLEKTNSFFIKKFGLIFFDAVDSDANPSKVGFILSKTFEDLLVLREKKLDKAFSYFGAFTGIIATGSISLFLGIGLINIMNYISLTAIKPVLEEAPEIAKYLPFTFQIIPIKHFVLTFYAILVIQSLLFSLMINYIRGGFWQSVLKYFVFWVFMITFISIIIGDFFSEFLKGLVT